MARIIACLPNPNLFSTTTSTTTTTTATTTTTTFTPPIPIPKYPPKQQKQKQKQQQQQNEQQQKQKHPAFRRIPHNKTKFFKPISPNSPTIIPSETDTESGSADRDRDRDRAVVIGNSGVSYLLPGAPFEFKFSYSETPKAPALAIREPAFLPFAPPTMPRPWTGKAPLLSKKEKLLKKKKLPLFESLNPVSDSFEAAKTVYLRKRCQLGEVLRDVRSREEILGEPLSKAEVKAFVMPLLSDNRQVNLGRDGLTLDTQYARTGT